MMQEILGPSYISIWFKSRTGGPGMNGLSLILIERTMPGVSTRHMACSGVWASGTTYITFEDVKVPVENLIGKENKGFKVIACVLVAICEMALPVGGCDVTKHSIYFQW